MVNVGKYTMDAMGHDKSPSSFQAGIQGTSRNPGIRVEDVNISMMKVSGCKNIQHVLGSQSVKWPYK